MNPVLLGLGTNLGDRRENLRRAVIGLAAKMDIVAIAPLYETEPWGVHDQPHFINTCVAAEVEDTAEDVLKFVKSLEIRLGRQSSVRWGPRLIDIDILFFDDLVIHQPGLRIPHPAIAERSFVLAPLVDMIPSYIHPEIGISMDDMLAEIDATGARKLKEPLFSLDEIRRVRR